MDRGLDSGFLERFEEAASQCEGDERRGDVYEWIA